jgi:hypothetical protein
MRTARAFDQIHQTSGTREADAELPLQHRRRSHLCPDHELHRFAEQVVAVLVVRSVLGDRSFERLRLIRRLRLRSDVGRELFQFLLRHVRALNPARLGRPRRQEEHVAVSDELVGAGHVDDDA